ncbi:Serine/threonine protein kinase [Methylorubrum populi]
MMRPFRRPSPAASAAVLGGLLLASLPGFALAQSVANPNDQPTAGTLPPGTDTVRGNGSAAERPTGGVSAPSAIRPSTSVVPEGKGKGSGRRSEGTTRTNPSEHLSKPFRSKHEN